ncbi:hypothetical protein IPM65_04120 [Candidatus Roizmanbacteria bacterium]|nr:MAG: hypothetical protein IPM65_04120 [Candidatus Roizmanbacteria bacterium]
MDYTDEDLEKLLEKEKTPFSLYLKVFFLIGMVSLGALFLHIYSRKAPEPTEETGSKTLEAVLGMKDQIVGNEKIRALTKEVENEGVFTALNTVKNEVQDEATKAADQTIDKTTDSTIDYIYDKTIVQVIEKMIQSLPERQREQFIDRMCRPE